MTRVCAKCHEMSHKSASFQQILAPLELEPCLRRGRHACRGHKSACAQGGARDGWGSSPDVSVDIAPGGAWRWRRKSLWRSGGRGQYDAAGQGSASFPDIQATSSNNQAASLPRWRQLKALTPRPHGRGSMRRGAGSGDRPLILFEGMICVLFEAGAPALTKGRSVGPVD